MLRNKLFVFAAAVVLTAVFSPSVSSPAAAKSVRIAGGGESPYVIVLADSASRSERYAAGEMAKWLNASTGTVVLPLSGVGRIRGIYRLPHELHRVFESL